jgi:DNA repair exonuclease SbcCD nuclease subunit
MIKILHSADWHMDAPMGGFSQEQRRQLRKEMLAVPGKIAAVCREEGCHLVLLSGDLFDSHSYTEEAVEAMKAAFAEMAVPVFISPGNHDFYSENSPWFKEEWPENVFLFKKQSISAFRLPALNCRVYGAAFTGMDCPGLLEGFSAKGSEQYALMVLHGDPTAPNSAYCPVTGAQVRASGLDYLALGHIHAPGRFGPGGGMCAWPGCPMGHGYDETGVKGVLIVELEQRAELRFVPLDTPRFYDLEVDADGDAVAALEEVLPAAGSEDFYRISLTGSGEVDLQALYARFREFPNLILRDKTEAPLETWAEADKDSLEGIYFGMLRKAMEKDPQQAELIQLAAEISRKILSGREVKL